MSDVWTVELEKEESALTAELIQQSGEGYTLPMAGPDVLGGVKPVQKTDDMTKKVGIDENGRLWSEKESEQVIEEVIGKYLQNNPIISEETDPTVPEWAKQPNKPSYTAAEVGALPADTVIPDGGIPIPNTASVGQTVVVKAVDENGKPTEWEAADFPSGGDLELIYNTKTTEALAQLKVTTDNNGNPFELTKLLVIIKLPFRNTARETAYRISCGDESTAWHYLNVPATSNGWSFYIEQDATMHWGEYTSYKDGTYNSRAVMDAYIDYNPSRRCTFFTFYNLGEPDFEIYIFGRRA